MSGYCLTSVRPACSSPACEAPLRSERGTGSNFLNSISVHNIGRPAAIEVPYIGMNHQYKRARAELIVIVSYVYIFGVMTGEGNGNVGKRLEARFVRE